MNALLALMCLAAGEGQDAKPKKIVLIAGSLDTHPKESHEYERNVILLRHCLERSLKNVRVETHFNGWPADPSTLDDADTIFFTSGGSERNNEVRNPIYVGDRLSNYKQPKEVRFVNAIPRNPSGKILRRNLRDPYWVGKDRQVN